MLDSFEKRRLEHKEFLKFKKDSVEISWTNHWKKRKKEVYKEGEFLKILLDDSWESWLSSDSDPYTLHLLKTLNG